MLGKFCKSNCLWPMSFTELAQNDDPLYFQLLASMEFITITNTGFY